MKYTTTCEFCGKVYRVKYHNNGFSNWSSKHFWKFHATPEQKKKSKEYYENWERVILFPFGVKQ